MSARQIMRIGALPATLLWLGCIESTVQPDGPRAAGAVEGQVTRQDGTPVGGPIVTMALTTVPDGGTARVLTTLQVIATDQGRFTALFILPEAPLPAEVSIHVQPPIGSQLSPLDTLRIPVTLRDAFPPRDTTYVQLELAPR